MNIRNNIINYLVDKNYVITTFDDKVYVYKYNFLEIFNNKKIRLKLEVRSVDIVGENLVIVKMTKDEILIKGDISSIEMNDLNG